MKLDRNVNPDGKGKYALINLRTNQVQWGGDGDQFFVIKYKDLFASVALKAYGEAVINYANSLTEKMNVQFDEMTKEGKHVEAGICSRASIETVRSILEYGSEIMREAETAENYPHNLPD